MRTLFLRKFIFILLHFVVFCSFSQDHNSVFYESNSNETLKSNFVSLHIKNSNFFRNNEYFSKLTDGQTFIGFYLDPSIYFEQKRIKIEAGFSSLKYFGTNIFSSTKPIFSIRYKFNPKFTFIFGSLKGNFNHKLLEPIYGFENYFERKTENGFQFLINNRFLNSDIWIDWQKFIFQDDPSQEEFTVGTSSRFFVFPESKNFNLIFQSLVTHKGGQIDISDDNLQTLANTASGIEYKKNEESSILNSYGFQSYFLTFNDLSFKSTLAFTKGFGIFNNVFLNFKYFNLDIAYWNANHFIAPKGEILFQSISDKFEKNYTEPQKQLLISKISLIFLSKENVNFALKFDSYYDILSQNFDFSYGFVILFEKEFFRKNLK